MEVCLFRCRSKLSCHGKRSNGPPTTYKYHCIHGWHTWFLPRSGMSPSLGSVQSFTCHYHGPISDYHSNGWQIHRFPQYYGARSNTATVVHGGRWGSCQQYYRFLTTTDSSSWNHVTIFWFPFFSASSGFETSSSLKIPFSTYRSNHT